jgi:hypothetical protein
LFQDSSSGIGSSLCEAKLSALSSHLDNLSP